MVYNRWVKWFLTATVTVAMIACSADSDGDGDGGGQIGDNPVFTSSGTVSVNENQTDAVTLSATAAGGGDVTYSISNGDAASFSVVESTGVVTFDTAPDFETKASYIFTATATDSLLRSTTQEVNITILDVCEANTTTITHNNFDYKEMCSPFTGKIWLDRNLGAAQVCDDYDDDSCFGGYYQWGRNHDGHQVYNSATTKEQATDVTTVGHGHFIESNSTYHSDWTQTGEDGRTTRKANWSKTDGSSVCPTGFRVPIYDELEAELLADGSAQIDLNSTEKAGNDDDVRINAFASFLKLPSPGYRTYINGGISLKNNYGYIWTSEFTGTDSSARLYWKSDFAGKSNRFRAYGHSVRCIKD